MLLRQTSLRSLLSGEAREVIICKIIKMPCIYEATPWRGVAVANFKLALRRASIREHPPERLRKHARCLFLSSIPLLSLSLSSPQASCLFPPLVPFFPFAPSCPLTTLRVCARATALEYAYASALPRGCGTRGLFDASRLSFFVASDATEKYQLMSFRYY